MLLDCNDIPLKISCLAAQPEAADRAGHAVQQLRHGQHQLVAPRRGRGASLQRVRPLPQDARPPPASQHEVSGRGLKYIWQNLKVPRTVSHSSATGCSWPPCLPSVSVCRKDTVLARKRKVKSQGRRSRRKHTTSGNTGNLNAKNHQTNLLKYMPEKTIN